MKKQYKSRVFSLMRLALNVVIALTILFTPHLIGQSPYRYDVIATSSSSFNILGGPSINNNGEVAFAARRIPGGGSVYVDNLPNSPRDVLPNFSLDPNTDSVGQLQINDSRQILAFYRNIPAAQQWIAIVDGRLTNFFTNVASNGFGGYHDFPEIFAAGLAFNNNNRPIFQTRSGDTATVLTTGVRGSFVSRQYFPDIGPSHFPMISDDDGVVVRRGGTGNDPILYYPKIQNVLFPAIGIAYTGLGFSQMGKSPSISRYSEAVAFYGSINQTGADAIGTNPGPGIFVSIRLDNGQRKLIRLAGRLIENNPAPGGNDDGACDPGETCIPGELGFNLAGQPLFFNSFDPDSRIDVAYTPSGRSGILDDLVTVSFIATPNTLSDVPGRIFSNQQGLWTLKAKIKLDGGNVVPDLAVPVAQVGDPINGNTVTGITVYDQLGNNPERVAFLANSAGGNMVVRAVRDPGTAVIFVAGVGGSTLLEESNGEKLWLPPSLISSLADLNIENPVRVPDVLRKDTIIVPFYTDTDIVTYKPILDYLKDSGYVEYNVNDSENNRNENCGGQNMDVLRAKHPTLFVFPYDWRRSIGDELGNDRNVDKLKNYIACVRQIYPNAPG